MIAVASLRISLAAKRIGRWFFGEASHVSCVLVCVASLTAVPPAAASVGSQSKTSDLALYNEARSRLGRGADAHVQLAYLVQGAWSRL